MLDHRGLAALEVALSLALLLGLYAGALAEAKRFEGSLAKLIRVALTSRRRVDYPFRDHLFDNVRKAARLDRAGFVRPAERFAYVR
jgi:hypothetical protein